MASSSEDGSAKLRSGTFLCPLNFFRKNSSLKPYVRVSSCVSQRSSRHLMFRPSVEALAGGSSPDRAIYFIKKPPAIRHSVVWEIFSSTSLLDLAPDKKSSTYLHLVRTSWAKGRSSLCCSARYSSSTPAWFPVDETPYQARDMTQMLGSTSFSKLSWKRNSEKGRAESLRCS